MYWTNKEVTKKNLMVAAVLCCLTANGSDNHSVSMVRSDDSPSTSRLFLTCFPNQESADQPLWQTEVVGDQELTAMDPVITETHVLLSGSFSGLLTFGNMTLTSRNQDAFFAIYDRFTGNLVQLGQMGAATPTKVEGLSQINGVWNLNALCENLSIQFPIDLNDLVSPGLHSFKFEGEGNLYLKLDLIGIPQLKIIHNQSDGHQARGLDMFAVGSSPVPPPIDPPEDSGNTSASTPEPEEDPANWEAAEEATAGDGN